MIDLDESPPQSEEATTSDYARFLSKVMSHRGPLHRRDTPEHGTDSTLFSVPSTASPAAAGGTGGTASTNHGGKKKGKGKKFKLSSLGSLLKKGRKKSSLSESQLRKRLRRHAERGDWDAARQLIREHEFSSVPEARPKRGSFNAEVIPEEPPSRSEGRRPSYGSRGGDSGGLRRSFTGKESAAAAAVIKAALLEEGSGGGGTNDASGREGPRSSSDNARPVDVGENVLHDLCRHRPPLDAVELLLAGLRHRRGSARGTDDGGRTPLHVAADAGAAPGVIDALVRADPSPASMGDADGRTPLHLAVRRLVHHPALPPGSRGGKHPPPSERTPAPEDTIDRTLRVVKILKEAMLAYPGRIDFKDEDGTGYSPLDYAIDARVHKWCDNDGPARERELIQALIRRKEPRMRRGHRPRGITLRSSNRSVASSAASSVTEDQDLEILLQLEREEVDARRRRLDDMRAARRKEQMSDALFDVFGIEERRGSPSPPGEAEEGASRAPSVPNEAPGHEGPLTLDPSARSAGHASGEEQRGRTDEDEYHRHLEAYLDDYYDREEFSGLDCADDDGFDIFEDPSEAKYREGGGAAQVRAEVGAPPVFEIRVDEDDDCRSIVSEVTVAPALCAVDYKPRGK